MKHIQGVQLGHRRHYSSCAISSLSGRLNIDQSSAIKVLSKTVDYLKSENGQLLLFGLLCYVVFSGHLSWIFDSFLILFTLLTILPVLGLVIFRWWASKNVVQFLGTFGWKTKEEKSICPNCEAPVVGIRGQEFPCNSCGYILRVDDGMVSVADNSTNASKRRSSKASSSVIDVDAREVTDD
eukprot:jgi/Galph1/2449/GphlegSOOS_G1091.1